MSDEEPVTPKPRRKRRATMAQTMGGVIFGFEQQVWRTAPPPWELVHHARPDAAVPSPDGTLVTFELPPTMDESAVPPEPTESIDKEEPKR